MSDKTRDENPVLGVVLPFGVVLLGVVVFRLLNAFTTPDRLSRRNCSNTRKLACYNSHLRIRR